MEPKISGSPVSKTQSTWQDHYKQKLEEEKKPVHINSIWNVPIQANAVNS